MPLRHDPAGPAACGLFSVVSCVRFQVLDVRIWDLEFGISDRSAGLCLSSVLEFSRISVKQPAAFGNFFQKQGVSVVQDGQVNFQFREDFLQFVREFRLGSEIHRPLIEPYCNVQIAAGVSLSGDGRAKGQHQP